MVDVHFVYKYALIQVQHQVGNDILPTQLRSSHFFHTHEGPTKKGI